MLQAGSHVALSAYRQAIVMLPDQTRDIPRFTSPLCMEGHVLARISFPSWMFFSVRGEISHEDPDIG